ncbi:putative EG45-like domain containing protein, plant [Helianthus annuus]|nr:putative EG45-like domain containing protein, plant [Helianthus annuus]KAJ0766972.1 putative EG45-like domain containing protein, plant [Helianthus annuus]
MGFMTRIAMVACLTSVAHAIAGQATFYTPPYVLCCLTTAACGTRYRVTCTGRTNLGVLEPCTGQSVDVTVVDLCPGCASDQIDLSQEAFAVIANPDAGRILIDYVQ